MNKLNLIELTPGEEAVIIEILGGHGLRKRLEALGLNEGQKVKKLGRLGWGGPVILLINRAQIAIGHSMAQKIFVQVNGNG